MSSDQKLPVNIDLAAKIEARFEAKTEIPAESSGRLLDALTDLIRPISEARGLKADQIRLQREDIAYQIVQKALKRKELENLQFNPISNKVLVPLLEKASLEDKDSSFIDWWSNLLTRAAQGKMNRPYFAELMSQLGEPEGELLSQLWDAFCKREIYVIYPNHFPKEIFERMREDIARIVTRPTTETEAAWRLTTCFDLQKLGQEFVGSGTKFGAGFKFGWNDEEQRFEYESEIFSSNRVSIDICRGLNLLTYESHIDDFGVLGMQQNYEIGILRFTVLGAEFMRSCTRKPHDAPATRT
jgi:hypothetical protein